MITIFRNITIDIRVIFIYFFWAGKKHDRYIHVFTRLIFFSYYGRPDSIN